MKKILTGCGGCLVLVIAALIGLWFVGRNAPREHVATSRITVAKTVEEVWPLVSDLEGQSDWLDGIESVERITNESGREVFVQHGTLGEVPLIIVENEAPHRFATQVDVGEEQWGGTWRWELTPNEGGCTISITEEGWVDNPLMRLVAAHAMDHHQAMDMVLTNLARHLGEEREPEHLE